MLSPVLCILPQETMLQIETGRQRDPKESWMEESHRSFYTYRGFYAEKSLHKGAFYTQKVLHREVFTLRSFCAQTSRSLYTQKLLHKEVFTQKAFYTQTRLHTEAFTQRSLHTKELLHTKAFGGCPKLLFPQRPLGPSLRQPCAFLARPHARITFIISVVFHHYSRTCFRMLNI